MGIPGLLPVLKSTTSPVHIKDYSGMVAAVDTYSWLHKGAISCSKELCHGLPTSKFIDYCMHRVNLLRRHGVKPLLVFDGGRLPMKEEQENKRARSRKLNLEKALEHERKGNAGAAYDCYQRAVDITPQIAFELVKVLQKEQVAYVVAPYEADAQLAFLSIQGHADVIITEDSDAIPFGCRKVLFKMDKFGQGFEFRIDELANNRDLNFSSFTKQMVLEMCILSGCDYLPSLPGMGVKRAHALIRRFGNYRKVVKHIQYNGVTVPPSYEQMFTRAILTFQHHWVYDPILEEVVHLTPIPSGSTWNLDFLGPVISQKHGQAIAKGEIDPISGLPFEPEQSSMPSTKTYSTGGRKRQLDLPIQKNSLTNYFLSTSTEAKRQFKSPRNVENLIKVGSKMTVDLEVKDDGLEGSVISQPLLDFPPLELSLNVAERKTSKTFDFSTTVEEEDEVLDFLNSKLDCNPSPVSFNPDEREKKTMNVRIKKYSQKVHPGSCTVRSTYFSTKAPSEGFSKDPNAEQNTETVTGREAELVGYSRKHRSAKTSNSRRSTTEKIGESLDHLSAVEKKHIPERSSNLPGERMVMGKFASDVSHIEQYAAIARKSMENFVAAIAPFRCSAAGARASGLRRPARANVSEKCDGVSSKHRTADDLKKFAYVPFNCRLQGDSVPGLQGGPRLKHSAVSD